jgi:type IV pilus assembly protein PilC
MIHIPLFGIMVKKAALAAFARQLALLSDSGVPIVRALEITANSVGNEVYRLRLLDTKEDVERGITIHKNIEGDPLFPDLVVSMIAVGEQTAQLGSVAHKIAEFYDEEVDTFAKNLSTIMEPLIIVVIGTLVGGLVAAIMQPIMDMTDIAAKA